MLQIFLSYSHADRERTTAVFEKSKSLGYEPWMDSTRLKGGQDWARELRAAIKDSDAVVVCFSQGLSQGRSYVHREWRSALDVMQELPPGAVYVIPLRLDDCTVPEELSHLQRIDWFTDDGPQKFEIALQNVAAQKIEFNKADLYRQLKPIIQKFGAVIHLDQPSGTLDDARQLTDYLSQNIDRSTKLLERNDWISIISLWIPMSLNPFFDLRNPYIQKVPVVCGRLQVAKSHLFFAHAWLSAGEPNVHIVPAAKGLEEILSCEPFPTQNLGAEILPAHVARIQNENYLFLLKLATRWLDNSEYYLITRKTTDTDRLRDTVDRRKAQLKLLV